MSRACRGCGCTEEDCSGCIVRTGAPCSWSDGDPDLCTACVEYGFPQELTEDEKYTQLCRSVDNLLQLCPGRTQDLAWRLAAAVIESATLEELGELRDTFDTFIEHVDQRAAELDAATEDDEDDDTDEPALEGA